MAVKLNDDALKFARTLIKEGKAVHDERDDWSEDAPSTDEENAFIEKHGWDEYAKWDLGIDRQASAETKGRFSFPFGDFAKIHRCAVISLESRAGQNNHDDIEKASKSLLDELDKPE